MPRDVTPRVSVRVSEALMARLDALAAAWGTSRAMALRRLIAEADLEGAPPPGTPDMGELLALASEKARRGNVAAMNFIAQRLPDERDQELQRLLGRLGAGDQ